MIERDAALALVQNAPVTRLNNVTGHHGFETRDDDAATRHVIDETLEFVKDATTPAYRAALHGTRLEVVAAALVATGKFHDAATTYAELLSQRPSDGAARFAYAQALLADRQFAAACAEFRRPASVSFEAIRPGARACVLAGLPDTAMAWLQTIRKDWMRSEYLNVLKTDSVFTPLWARREFDALFRP